MKSALVKAFPDTDALRVGAGLNFKRYGFIEALRQAAMQYWAKEGKASLA